MITIVEHLRDLSGLKGARINSPYAGEFICIDKQYIYLANHSTYHFIDGKPYTQQTDRSFRLSVFSEVVMEVYNKIISYTGDYTLVEDLRELTQ